MTEQDRPERPSLSLRQRLALAAHNRRQALYEARQAHGERPSRVPELTAAPVLAPAPAPARDSMPTLDDLTSSDPVRAKPARWRLVLVIVAALGGLGELARQVSALFAHK